MPAPAAHPTMWRGRVVADFYRPDDLPANHMQRPDGVHATNLGAVAVAGGRVVAQLSQHPRAQRVALYVDPLHRRQGYARRLFEAYADRRGAPVVIAADEQVAPEMLPLLEALLSRGLVQLAPQRGV